MSRSFRRPWACASVAILWLAPRVFAQSAERAIVASSPGAHQRAIGFYDPTLRRVIIVGGDGQVRAGVSDVMWTWDGVRWERLPEVAPRSRANAGGAFDERRGVAVIAGGAVRTPNDSGYEVTNESFERTARGWRKLAGAAMSPRDHLALAYHAKRRAVIVFGGSGPGHPCPSDTWELSERGWQPLAESGPAGRLRTAMAYDGKREMMVLFGGVGCAPGEPQRWFNDTWVMRDGAWTMVARDGPRARYAHGMVFDERAGVVLMYGGAAAHRGAPLADMWQWDGTRWTEIVLSGPTPGHRYQPVMVFDRARGRTVLYGGGRDDTWEWDGQMWKEVATDAKAARATR